MDSQILFSRLSRRAEEALAMMQAYVDKRFDTYYNPLELIESVSEAVQRVHDVKNCEDEGYYLDLEFRLSQLKPLVWIFHAKLMLGIMQSCVDKPSHAACYDLDLLIACADEAIQQAKSMGGDATELEGCFVILKKRIVILYSNRDKKS